MSVKKMTRIALLSAILYVAQVGLAFLPNIEVVTLLIILYTLVFDKEAMLMIVIFNTLEGVQWGFGLWWVSYLYTWPLLCIIVLFIKKLLKASEEFILWAVVAGIFGLMFGAFFAVAYIPMDIFYAVTYWIAGLPWDVWHGVWNFVLMAILGKPLYLLLKKVRSFDMN